MTPIYIDTQVEEALYRLNRLLRDDRAAAFHRSAQFARGPRQLTPEAWYRYKFWNPQIFPPVFRNSMSKQRITIEVLASGQPRPYADHLLHVKVIFEVLLAWNGDEKDSRSKWVAWQLWEEAEVRACLKTLKCGFTDDPPDDWAASRLQRLWSSAPGIWEFIVTAAYTG